VTAQNGGKAGLVAPHGEDEVDVLLPQVRSRVLPIMSSVCIPVEQHADEVEESTMEETTVNGEQAEGGEKKLDEDLVDYVRLEMVFVKITKRVPKQQTVSKAGSESVSSDGPEIYKARAGSPVAGKEDENPQCGSSKKSYHEPACEEVVMKVKIPVKRGMLARLRWLRVYMHMPS
jgi:hypothetical protein